MKDKSSIFLNGLSNLNQLLEYRISFFEFVPSPPHHDPDNQKFAQAWANFIEKEIKLEPFKQELTVAVFESLLEKANPDKIARFFGDSFNTGPTLYIRGSRSINNFSSNEKSAEKSDFVSLLRFHTNRWITSSSFPISSLSKERSPSKILFVSLPKLELSKMLLYFEEIVLEPEEEIVQEALRIIEPELERIAIANGRKFFAKLSGQSRKVPLGNLGDGVRYLLALTLALVQVPNGILLVDDIDTGLHYSALTDMWKLVWETAKKLNVQVFATTHNSDCWQSLADIAEQDDVDDTDITIHRIEKELERSVAYTAPKIVIAVDRELEVR
ncbi:MAG: ATP-binding protein [Cyanothece sp. SIO2G6]|nr:ATP-binding protein [Cyanothece sp. SIO2G6]